MAKPRISFICRECGTAHTRWQGQCDGCGAWNSLVEEGTTPAPPVAGGGARIGKGRRIALETLSGHRDDAPCLPVGLPEFDRVAGGGLVPGSVILLGGEPGIGKSTLLIQVAAALARAGHRVAYVSGEEATAQVRLRAHRLGLDDAPVELAAETHVDNIVATLAAPPAPRLVIIDSIQTMWTAAVEAPPGTVTQIRASAQTLIRHAKTTGGCVILVGHVTKEGQIAGPRVVEHMVDAVLFFEGDSAQQFRLLRGLKNRFGATDEIGVFEMRSDGLREVENPSALFLGQRDPEATGASVFAGLEGTRPLLVEIQALVAPSPLGTPRRAVVGWDSNRLAMVLAVLETHAGVRLAGHDVYLNVAGGLRIQEPAADLAVAAALVSSLAGIPLPADLCVYGEIALSGAIRPVPQALARLKESAKLGFRRALCPPLPRGEGTIPGLALDPMQRIADLVAAVTAGTRVASPGRHLSG